MDNTGFSAAEMIRRFREATPTSPSERIAAKSKGEIGELWYNKSSTNFESQTFGKKSRVSFEKNGKDLLYESNSFDYGKNYNNMKNIEQPKSTSFRINSSVEGLDLIEDIIAKDIKRLESDYDRPKYNIQPQHQTYQNKPHTYDDLLNSKSYNDHNFHSSIETLGTTGFRGLLVPELKLDGRDVAPPLPSTGNYSDINASMETLLKLLGGKQTPVEDEYLEPDLATDITAIPQIPLKLEYELRTFNRFYENKYALEDAENRTRLESEEALIEQGRQRERELKLLELHHINDPSLDFVRLLQELDTAIDITNTTHYNRDNDDIDNPLQRLNDEKRVRFLSSTISSMDNINNLNSENNYTRSNNVRDINTRNSFTGHDNILGTSIDRRPLDGNKESLDDAMRLSAQFRRSNNFIDNDNIISTNIENRALHGNGIGLEEAMRLSAQFSRSSSATEGPLAYRTSDISQMTARHMKALRHQLGLRIEKLDDLYSSILPEDHQGHYSSAIPTLVTSDKKDHNRRKLRHSSIGRKGIGEYDYEYVDIEDYKGLGPWNPYPELVHKNIMSTDVAITSLLDSTMQTLHLRLPCKERQLEVEEWEKDHPVMNYQRGSTFKVVNKMLYDAMGTLETELLSVDAKELMDRWIEIDNQEQLKNVTDVTDVEVTDIGSASIPPICLDNAKDAETQTQSQTLLIRSVPPPAGYIIHTLGREGIEVVEVGEEIRVPSNMTPSTVTKDDFIELDKILGPEVEEQAKELRPNSLKKRLTAVDVGLAPISDDIITAYVNRFESGVGQPLKPTRSDAVLSPPPVVVVVVSAACAPRPSPIVPTAPPVYYVPAAPLPTPTPTPLSHRRPVEGHAMKVYRQASRPDAPPELVSHIYDHRWDTNMTNIHLYSRRNNAPGSYYSSPIGRQSSPIGGGNNGVPHPSSAIHDRATYLEKMRALRGQMQA